MAEITRAMSMNQVLLLFGLAFTALNLYFLVLNFNSRPSFEMCLSLEMCRATCPSLEKSSASVSTKSIATTFFDVASASKPVTDKITTHAYQTLYNVYFNADVQAKQVKLLEIGLGCDMNYGPGASEQVWSKLLPKAEVWFAEYDAACVTKYWNPDKKWGFVTGDQADIPTLKTWVKQSKGNFDFIIDDGGHSNQQIWNSFQVLFSTALKPGGVYFIEDMQVAYASPWYRGGVFGNASIIKGQDSSTMPDVITQWIRQLLSGPHSGDLQMNGGYAWKYRIPDIASIHCSAEMCAITKK